MSVKVHLDKEGVTSGRMCFTLSAGSLINQQKSELGFTFPVMYLLEFTYEYTEMMAFLTGSVRRLG